jgi:hypothetical protein
LARRVEAVVQQCPAADPDNVRLTLMALEWTPESSKTLS